GRRDPSRSRGAWKRTGSERFADRSGAERTTSASAVPRESRERCRERSSSTPHSEQTTDFWARPTSASAQPGPKRARAPARRTSRRGFIAAAVASPESAAPFFIRGPGTVHLDLRYPGQALPPRRDADARLVTCTIALSRDTVNAWRR